MSRYDYLREKYPKVINKEDMRKILHIGKRKATWILQQNYIPHQFNGKKTRCYKIEIDDLIRYIEDSEDNPDKYIIPNGIFAYKSPHEAEVKINAELLEEFLKNEFERLCEGLSTKEVQRVTGYSLTSIVKWINSNKLKGVKVKNKFVVPKDELIYFLCGYGYYKIHPKSKKHLKIMNKYWNS